MKLHSPPPLASRRLNPGKTSFWILCLLLLVLIVGHAWVAEDAFITFRVVDNAVHGYGLRWNVDERVEVFTSPLWLLLHLPIRALHPNIFLGTIVFSVLCAGAAVAFAARSASKSRGVTAVTLILPLVLSKGFLEFSTSGLENPLSFLLAALFSWILLTRGRRPEATPWFGLTCIASLATVNRMDTVLVYLPALGYLLFTRRRHVRWAAILGGALPFLAWKAFSLLYYGFPFPNTAYAKLGTGLSRWVYAKQGLFYLLDFPRRDPAAFLVTATVAAGVVVALARRRGGILTFLGLGALAYGAYVVSIGGDFMTLRFWSLPFFLSIIILHAVMPTHASARRLAAIAVCLGGAKLATVWTEPAVTVQGNSVQRVWQSIEDERLAYVEGHALFSFRREPRFRLSAPPVEPVSPRVVMWWAVGLKPYMSGPQTVVVDAVGLADPLLARLPALRRETLFIGHFRRGIPRGYMEARLTENWSYIADDNLRQYYEKLRIITAGPLFQRERWRTILAFHRGRYEALRRKFLASEEPYAPVEDGKWLFLKKPDGSQEP